MRVERVHRQGCGDMKHPRAIFSILTSLTVRRRELGFHAANFAAAESELNREMADEEY